VNFIRARSNKELLSFPPHFRRKLPCDPWTINYIFFHYQTCCICILSKTQTQPPKQTLPSTNWINHFQYLFFKIKRLSIILKGLSFSLLKALLFIFSHIIIDELCKILYFPIGSSKYFFSSDLVLIKDQLILISYKKVWLKKEGSKWKSTRQRCTDTNYTILVPQCFSNSILV